MRLSLLSLHVFSRLPHLRFYSPHLRRLYRMEDRKVVVTHDEESMTVGLSFRFQHCNVDRTFNLKRSSEEGLSSVLTRISGNIQKVLDKKKKRNEDPAPVVPIDIKTHAGESVNKDMSCYECFVAQADHHFLDIGEKSYSLDVNPPIVKVLELPKNIMAGFPLHPSKLEMTNGVNEDSSFTWYKSDVKFNSIEETKSQMNKIKWVEMATGYTCFTDNDDVGRLLKVVMSPRRGERCGEDTEAIASVLVSAGPGLCPFERRHKVTKKPTGQNCLRVISYNILADQYADSEFARSNLFPSCPSYAIDVDYRKQLLIKEILGYNGDLICLQEVDEKVFMHGLQGALRKEGLEGVYAAKGGTVTEGVALFYRLTKLRLLETQRFILSKELQGSVLFAEIWKQIQCSEDLKEKVVSRFTCLQVSVLESTENPKQLVVVGVTHLYFSPEADHIRLLQAGIGLQILQQVMALYQNKYPEKEVSMLFAGDFNSTPEFDVYRLMTSQMASFDDIDWSDKENERVSGVSFSHDLELASACGCPPYTNYTKDFYGCLDYIYYQTDKFSVKQVVELPSHEEVTQHEFLPSITIPSDHLAIIADLEFKKK